MDSVSWFQTVRPLKLSASMVQFQGTSDQGDFKKTKDNSRFPQSDQLQLSAAKLNRSPHFNPQAAQVLLSVDYDGTLSTDLAGAERFQRQRSDCLLHLNTGRSVEDLAPLRERLGGLKLFALSTSNGEGLFVNDKGLPANQWIEEIAERQQRQQNAQLPGWQRWVQGQSGWDHFQAAKVIRSFIDRQQAYPGYGPLECVPRSKGVISAILETLRTQRIQADFSVEDNTLHKFSPYGFAKHSPVGFLAEQCPNLQQVVVAGDGMNDYALMTLESVVNGRGRSVRVDRVLVAQDNAFVRRVLRDAPNPFQVKVLYPRREKLFETIADKVASIQPAAGSGESPPSDELTVVTPRPARPVHPSHSSDKLAALFNKL